MEWILLKPTFWCAVLSLTALEIALGIDNIVFQSLELNKLSPEKQAKARSFSLAMTLMARPVFLCLLFWFINLPFAFIKIAGHNVTPRTITLLLGGLFLLWKSSREIHEKLDDGSGQQKPSACSADSFEQTLVQLVLLDIVCSFDSVITAVGMSGELITMLSALVLAVFLMMRFAEPMSRFILPRPRLQVLAFVFLFIIGLVLVAEGLGLPISRPAVYAIMGLVLALELPVSCRIGNTLKPARKARPSYAACAPQSDEPLPGQAPSTQELKGPQTEGTTDYAALLASLNRHYTATGEYRFFVDRV